MRGYGSWCMGWREAERLPPGPPSKPGIIFYSFIALVVFSCFKVAIESGSGFAFILGLAFIAGALKK